MLILLLNSCDISSAFCLRDRFLKESFLKDGNFCSRNSSHCLLFSSSSTTGGGNRDRKKYGNIRRQDNSLFPYSLVTSSNKVYLSDLIGASLQLSEMSAQVIVNVKKGVLIQVLKSIRNNRVLKTWLRFTSFLFLRI